ncbi:hypothetical protein OIU79_005191 [Salix purpurea]|uniref:Uncharacterized protein n=1 Tax=Salix purpurea TaxID=77065 RepID=A0A9Q0ZAK0_SALPP|nr:hypothetical protein OIU79_005191 [Salix purpurea]
MAYREPGTYNIYGCMVVKTCIHVCIMIYTHSALMHELATSACIWKMKYIFSTTGCLPLEDHTYEVDEKMYFVKHQN